MCCLGLLVARPAAGAAHDDARQGRREPSANPTVKGNLLVPVRRQLALAFGLALESLRTIPACSALFGNFGKDGAELLASVEFDAATFELFGDTCSRGGVAAFTEVRGRKIRLCPGFGLLTVQGAAVILIHEALHVAGLSERHVDPHGLAPQQINHMVAVSCLR